MEKHAPHTCRRIPGTHARTGDRESPSSRVPPAAADDPFPGLQSPVALEDVRAGVLEGRIEINFNLPEVGAVSVTLNAEQEGLGRGLVTVEDAIVTEVGLVDDIVVWETSGLSALSPAQARALVASLIQVWHNDAVTDALGHARDVKCTWAGKVGGSTIGVAVFAGCGLIAKSPKCYGWGFGVGSSVAGYITDKCNGAQNK